MGRQVIIEEVVQSFIDQLASKNEVAVGLVLGQVSQLLLNFIIDNR